LARKRSGRPPKRNSRYEDQDYKKEPYGSRNRRSNKEQSSRQPVEAQGYIHPIVPKTKGQERFLDSIRTNTITLCDGVSGVGKSYLAFGSALHYRESDPKIKKIFIVRPTIQAGDDNPLGYLPGDLEAKFAPYLAPLLQDSAHQLIDFGKNLNPEDYKICLSNYLKSIDLEMIPLALLRGRSLNGFIILDEAQNMTNNDFKLFITRMGKDSKVVVIGDSDQCDIPNSGYVEFQGKLQNLDGVGIVDMGTEDIIRHPMLASILRRLDQ